MSVPVDSCGKMWSRDAYGSIHNVKQFRTGEPQGDNKPPRAYDIHFTAHTPTYNSNVSLAKRNPTKISSQPPPIPFELGAPRRRRQLPQPPGAKIMVQHTFMSSKESLGFAAHPEVLPTSTTKATFTANAVLDADYDEEWASAADGLGGRTIQPLPPPIQCKFFCTATGPSTALKCLHCQADYCLACLHGQYGKMFIYDNHGTMQLKCAKCGRNPRTAPVDDRPPWQGSGSFIPGQPLALIINKTERNTQQHKALGDDRHFLQSLRVEDGRPRSAPTPDQEIMPSVFERLTDPKNFNGSHKHRFDQRGHGKGLEGRREDTILQKTIAGQATITRDLIPAVDSPHKPRLSFDNSERPKSATPRSRLSSQDAYTDEVMVKGVFSRLTSPTSKKIVATEYDKTEQVRKSFGVNRNVIPKWQSGV